VAELIMKSEGAFLFESAAWPVLVLNESGVIEFGNRAAATYLGPLVQSGDASVASIWASENELTWEAFWARVARFPGESRPLKFLTKGGTIVSFEGYVSFFTKDSQTGCLLQLLSKNSEARPRPRESAAERLPAHTEPGSQPEGSLRESSSAQKQKLDCALQLTRTVALDFNNALTSILGHTSLILSKMERNHPWRSSLLEIEKSAEKAAEVASDLAAFSRPEKDARSQVAGNLNDLVRRTLELFQGCGAGQIEWTLQLEPKLHTTTFEEAKMQQAFVKILDNAVQSVGAGGRVIVRTRNQEVSEPIQEANTQLAVGHYVCAEFEDNGSGIASDVLPRVFEPFFTTKESPNHRGLGLAWVYGIVTNHGGSVAVSSLVGRGTTVRVFLPAQTKIVRDHTLQTDDLSGSQTILMVDDEELLLTMGEMVLSSFGYRVLTANSGQKALELFSQHQGQIDLVITDLVMPKMSGRELIDQLRRLASDVKVICSSGYSRALRTEEEEMYLQKPFTSVDLLRKVKHALTHSEVS
jgi:two-component system, cell cycle sensor histidine kinase and response regulator CckA